MVVGKEQGKISDKVNFNLRKVNQQNLKTDNGVTQDREENIVKKSIQNANDVTSPTYVDCGITQINVPGVFNKKFTCVADGQPVQFDVTRNPAIAKGISIDSKTGVLTFSNFHEEIDVTVTVKAYNGVGSFSTSILVKHTNPEEKNGVWVKFNTVEQKDCSDGNYDVTIKDTYIATIADLSGFHADNTYYYTWYQLLGMKDVSETHSFSAEFEGHITTEAGKYKFIYTISEGMMIKVYIDDLETPKLNSVECKYGDITDTFEVELSEGNHVVFILLYSFVSYYEKSCLWIFNFEYQKPGEESTSVIPFKTRIFISIYH